VDVCIYRGGDGQPGAIPDEVRLRDREGEGGGGGGGRGGGWAHYGMNYNLFIWFYLTIFRCVRLSFYCKSHESDRPGEVNK
jgi:hypothetical protein